MPDSPIAVAKPAKPPLHPALHFDDEEASVGILDGPGKLVLVMRRLGHVAVRVVPQFISEGRWQADGRPLHPAPVGYPPLMARWDAGDVQAFCADGAAPGFAECLFHIRAELLRYIEFARPETVSLVACWIVGTYLHQRFTTFPRLNVTGPMGTGKSKMLQLIAALSFNGLHVVSPTPATLFRLIEPLRPTFCLDEMEQLDRADIKAIKGILNAGYKIGATVPRTEGEAKREVVSYEVYGPVAIAGIQGLDSVLADRSITVLMQRGTDKTRINSEIDPSEPVWGRLRARCYRLTLTRSHDVVTALGAVRDQQDKFTMLEGRLLELYRPLIAIALLAKAESGGDASVLADLSALVQEDADTREGLDPDSMRIFAGLETRLRTAPTITVYPGRLFPDEPGLWLPGGQVGKLLTRYGFPSKRDRSGQRYTITRERFIEQAKRYGYPAELGTAPEPE